MFKLLGWFGATKTEEIKIPALNTTCEIQEENDDVEIVGEVHSVSSPSSSTPQNFMNSVLESPSIDPVDPVRPTSPSTTALSPQLTPVLKERNRIIENNIRFKSPKSVDHWSRKPKTLSSVSRTSMIIRKAHTDSNYSPINLPERDKYMRMLKNAESPMPLKTTIRNMNTSFIASPRSGLDYRKLERVKKMLREKGASGSSTPSYNQTPVIKSSANEMPAVLVNPVPRRSTSESLSSISSCRDKLDDVMCLFDQQLVVSTRRHYVDDFTDKCQSARYFGDTFSVTQDICSKSRLDQKSIAEEEARERLALRGIVAPKPKPPAKDEFPELSDEAHSTVDAAWSHGRMDEVFADSFDIQIARKDLKTLRAPNWLNDEVINFYLQLICQRSKDVEGLPKVYAFNTFFYPNITTKGYASVKRWTRKVDLFSFDIVLVPVHMHNNHWCMAVMDISNKQVDYFDSLHGKNQRCLDALRDYLISEHNDKKKSALDMTGWVYQMRPDCPAQMNGSDCGMFSLKFAEFASRRKEICFNQEHMPYYRKRAVYEIMSKTLL